MSYRTEDVNYSSEQHLFHQVVNDVVAENGWWMRKCQEMEYTNTEFAAKKRRVS